MRREFRLSIETPRKKRKKKPELCEDCKTPLRIHPGWGSCETCHRGAALPIGWVATSGHHEGKEVFLASALMRELRQDCDPKDAKEELEDELRSKDYFVVWDHDYEE